MTNPHKGEVSFKAEGREYILRYSAEAIVQMETELGMGVIAIAEELRTWAPPTDDKGNLVPEPKEAAQARLGRMRLGFIRTVFWACLQEHQPDIDVKRAGDLIMSAGGMLLAMKLISLAFISAFPRAETKGARPMNRAARRRAAKKSGTGPTS